MHEGSYISQIRMHSKECQTCGNSPPPFGVLSSSLPKICHFCLKIASKIVHRDVSFKYNPFLLPKRSQCIFPLQMPPSKFQIDHPILKDDNEPNVFAHFHARLHSSSNFCSNRVKKLLLNGWKVRPPLTFSIVTIHWKCQMDDCKYVRVNLKKLNIF